MFKLFQETKSLKWVYKEKKSIDFSPPYQRRGNLWTKEQKQLLIDSIFNGFDIPKFYFQFMPSNEYSYAIIDGKQRIEAIIGFINDEFPMSPRFRFIDQNVSEQFASIAGKYYSEIDTIEPALLARFWQFQINIVFIDSSEPDTINEMFVRLNSGVTVSTTEKRNANGGLLTRKIQEVCSRSIFFVNKISLGNRRFEHNDLLLKLLMIEMGNADLTKASVDKFVIENKGFSHSCERALQRTEEKLNRIAYSFFEGDKLLKKKNIIITLYSIVDNIDLEKTRDFLNYFEALRMEAQKNNTESDLTEFNRLLQQGADKKASVYERGNIMLKYWDLYCSSN